MRRAGRVLTAALLAFGCAGSAAAAHYLSAHYLSARNLGAGHKFHASLSQVEYNAQTQSAEIIIRMFADDLENALSLRGGKSVRVDSTENFDSLTLAYLREMFELKNGDGQVKTLAWVGKEVKVDSVWAYLEAKMHEGLMGAQVRNRIFFDLFDDQVNRVNVRQAGEKADLVFKPGDGFKAALRQSQ